MNIPTLSCINIPKLLCINIHTAMLLCRIFRLLLSVLNDITTCKFLKICKCNFIQWRILQNICNTCRNLNLPVYHKWSLPWKCITYYFLVGFNACCFHLGIVLVARRERSSEIHVVINIIVLSVAYQLADGSHYIVK